MLFVFLFSSTYSGIAEARYSLRITITDVNQIGMEGEKSTFLKGDSKILAYKNKLTAYAKTTKAKKQAIDRCKEEGVYNNARVKVLNASRATAGLGNLKSPTVSTLKVASQFVDLPEYSEEEDEYLEAEYSLYSEYPDYIEEGYVSFFLEFNCSHLGIISVTNSNFYSIYIDGDYLEEFSKAELVRMKWSIIIREDEF